MQVALGLDFRHHCITQSTLSSKPFHSYVSRQNTVCYLLCQKIIVRRLYRSCIFTSGNTPDIFFNANAKKKQKARNQMTSGETRGLKGIEPKSLKKFNQKCERVDMIWTWPVNWGWCCCAYLSSSHQRASDANDWTIRIPHTFDCGNYFVIGEISAYLGVFSDSMFVEICWNSCPLNFCCLFKATKHR